MKNRSKPRWTHSDHIFTPNHMMKEEFSNSKVPTYIKPARRFSPKPLKHGPVIYLMKDGKEVRDGVSNEERCSSQLRVHSLCNWESR